MGGRHSKSYRVVAEEGSISDVGIIRRTGSGPDLTTQQQQQQQQPSQSSEEDSTMISTVLCQVDDLKDGQMKDFTVEGKKVLLVKDEGQFHAIGAKCTHYGANLATGAYSNGRVRCPWHGACFSVTTGDIEDFPGLDSLPKFQTKIEGNSVVLLATKEELEVVKRTKPMCSMADDCHEAPVIIVGGGAAALTCAESLRQHSYQGNIIMMTQESSAPYDRIKLSKAPDTPVDKILLRTADFYEKHKIQILTNSQVTSVSVVDKAVTLADQDTVHYSKLVIATGGTPRTLTCPGADLQGIHYLRTPQDGLSISESVQGRDVVIIGSSFIGMELAASLVAKVKSITCVDALTEPFQMVLGEPIGRAMRKVLARDVAQTERC
uniref:Rieske domain-containing protein n=1 Tax=Plectus sambesii TaxID=2011161 RepID=A0A914VU33_9BILA